MYLLDVALEAVKRRFGGKPRSAVAPFVREDQAPSPAIAVRSSNMQPQSDRDIQPIVDALRKIDPLLGIRWNAEARLIKPGHYTETGKLFPPEYDGRWNVTRAIPRDQQRDYEGRDYIVICEVTEPHDKDGVIFMERGGGFAPLGQWLVEYIRSADAANARAFDEIRRRLWAQDQRVTDEEEQINEAEAREGLGRGLFKANYAGGVGVYPGKGADFKEMESRSPHQQSPLIVTGD